MWEWKLVTDVCKTWTLELPGLYCQMYMHMVGCGCGLVVQPYITHKECIRLLYSIVKITWWVAVL